MLSIASLMGSALSPAKTLLDFDDKSCSSRKMATATRVRILHRSVGTLVGLVIAGVTLHFHIQEGYTLAGMLLITLVSYLTIRKNYGWATVGFTVTAVYTLQLLTLNGEQFIVPRFIDTITGC